MTNQCIERQQATELQNAALQKIREQLFAMQDMQYREFQSKLMPTVSQQFIIGIRIPAIRKYAKLLAKTPESTFFMQLLPHKYYEENNLHGFLIETIKDFDTAIAAIDMFLPYVDNWATCDTILPSVFKKNLDALLLHIRRWLNSGATYTIRFAIGLLMRFYLDEHFSPEFPQLVASVESDEYYVRMMVAWYFATALAKQFDAVIPFIRDYRLAPWTHNKTIQKAIESNRILDKTKMYLRSLRLPSVKVE